jgi:hypothetical protein
VIQPLGDGEGPSGHLGTEFAPVRGGISVAANLHTAGGASAAGGNGGAGGTILITQSATDSFTDTPPGLNPISVVGLLSMTSTGGAGSADGGAAGVVEIRNFKMLDTTLNPNDGIDVFFVGAVHNEVPLIALGGNATAGTGGAGGQLIISGDSVVNLDSPKGRTSTNTAALDCRGGDGVAGGDGGFIGIESTFRTTNSGSMICSGGSATSGDGGRAGQVNLGSIMHLVNSGDITANGGDSLTGTGGGAFGVYLWGSDWWGGDSAEGSATNSGAIVSSGGAGAVGGNADDIFVVDHYSVRNSGPLTGNGGNGSAGDGGLAATIYLLSDDALNSSGAITALGGGGTGAGSVGRNGGQVLIAGGPSVRHAGGITATGGAAELGGDGGQIRFNSVGGFSTVGGTMNVFRGAGAPAANNGVTGNVFRDGVEAPLSALGTVTF